MSTGQIIVLNPCAWSGKAQNLGPHLERLAGAGRVVATARPGDATRKTTDAVRAGARVIVAAGGDGTLNEVINGLVGTDAILGIIPMGTVNVLARELKIPLAMDDAWEVIENGVTRTIDLIRADYHLDGKPQTRYFVQLAGAGLDAHIVKQVSWKQKKRWGLFSYVFESIKSLTVELPRLTIRIDGNKAMEGSLVLIGNGIYYAGSVPVFKKASLTDGLMDICLFTSGGCLDLLRYLQAVLRGTHISTKGIVYRHGRVVEIDSPVPVPVQLDGEFVGYSPARMKICPGALRVLVPGGRVSCFSNAR